MIPWLIIPKMKGKNYQYLHTLSEIRRKERFPASFETRNYLQPNLTITLQGKKQNSQMSFINTGVKIPNKISKSI
jgi:hypothetical protein